MNSLKTFFIALSSLLFVQSAFCESGSNIRIATVDVNRVLNESKEAKIKKVEFDSKTSDAKQKVETKKNNLKQLEDKIKASGASEDSKEVLNLREQVRDYSRYVKDTEDTLREQFMKINKVLTEKALGIIKKYADSKNYDLVLDKSGKERGPVLFGSESADITDKVIEIMNQS
jgi:Skp family chaperone for outer membrane proteins